MELSLVVENLQFGYSDAPVLHGITLPAMCAGEVTAVVGPNAAGKSTLLKCIAGIHRTTGRIALNGVEGDAPPVERSPRRLRRRSQRPDRILYTPQDPLPPSSITVFEAVLLARQQELTGRPSPALIDEISCALTDLRLDALATRPLSDLSGGQRQMVSLAQAVIRRPAAILLDEPTSSLDLRNQLDLLALVSRIAREQPAVVMIAVHDLGLAARFADRMILLHRGRVHASGRPCDVITERMLRDVYRIDARVHTTADGLISVAARSSL